MLPAGLLVPLKIQQFSSLVEHMLNTFLHCQFVPFLFVCGIHSDKTIIKHNDFYYQLCILMTNQFCFLSHFFFIMNKAHSLSDC